MTARRNEVAVIAHLAPRTISFLQVPLTPARQAALDAFCTRTGISAQALATDLLDDVIFDMGPPCTAFEAGASARADNSSGHFERSAQTDRSSACADIPSTGRGS